MREFKIHQWWTTFKKGENFNLLQIEMTKNFLYPISNQSKLWRNPSYLIQYIAVPIHQSLGKNVIATSAKKVYIHTTGPLQGVRESLEYVCSYIVGCPQFYKSWNIFKISNLYRIVNTLQYNFPNFLGNPVFGSLFRPISMTKTTLCFNIWFWIIFHAFSWWCKKIFRGLIFDVNSSNIWCTKSRKDFNDFRPDKDLSWKDALLAITSLLMLRP